MIDSTRRILVFFGLGLLAALVRSAAALSLWSLPHGYVLNADSLEYHRLSMALAGMIDVDLPGVFGLSPLAVAWGALWHFLLGPSLWAVVVPQIALGVGTVLLTEAIARRMAGDAAGIIAGVLVALCQPLAMFDAAILATPLAVFTSTLCVWLSIRLVERETTVRLVALGLGVGLAVVGRPNFALFLPVALLVAWRGRSPARSIAKKVRAAGIVLGAAVLMVAPVTIHNGARGEAFVPVTSSMGMNLFIGNNQGSNGRFYPVFGARSAEQAFEAFEENAERVAGRELGPSEISRFWTEQTGAEIADAPGKFVILLGKKTLYMLNEHPVPDNLDQTFIARHRTFYALPLPGFGLLFPLGLVGLLSLRRGRSPGLGVVSWAAVVPLLTMLIFFVSDRYRAPMLPMLSIGVGALLPWLRDRVGEIRSGAAEEVGRRAAVSLAVSSLVLAATVTVSRLPILHDDHAPEWKRLQAAYVSEGDLEAAAGCQAAMGRESREPEPGSASPYELPKPRL